MMDSNKIKENNKLLYRDGGIDKYNYRRCTSKGLIYNNYYIGINLYIKINTNIPTIIL